jgi:proline iminopeptidase
MALFYALLHPSSVDRLAYLSGRGPLAWWRASGGAACRSTTRSRMTSEQVELLAALGELPVRGSRDEAEFRFLSWMSDFRDPESSPALQAMVDAPFAINFAVNRLLSSDEPLEEDLLRPACEQLDVPVLIVHGEDDPRPVEGPMLLADWIPASSVHVVPDAAHLPWVEQPAIVQELLTTFLGAR